MHPRHVIPILLSLILLAPACAHKAVPIGTGPSQQLDECLKLSEKKKFESAIECLGTLKARYPRSPEGQEAELRIADNYYRKKEYLLAAESYKTFIKLHPLHDRVDYAFYRLGASYFEQTPKAIDRDQQYLTEAIDNFNIVVQSYPGSTYRDIAQRDLDKARLKMARRDFYVGHFYYRTGEYVAAYPRFMDVATRYPESGLGPKSLHHAIHAAVALDELDRAKEAFGIMSAQYSASPLTQRTQDYLIRVASKKKNLKETLP